LKCTPGCRSCEHTRPHQRPILIHCPLGQGNPPFPCPGTSYPSSIHLSQSPCRTNLVYHSHSACCTLHNNRPTHSPQIHSSCQTSIRQSRNQSHTTTQWHYTPECMAQSRWLFPLLGVVGIPLGSCPGSSCPSSTQSLHNSHIRCRSSPQFLSCKACDRFQGNHRIRLSVGDSSCRTSMHRHCSSQSHKRLQSHCIAGHRVRSCTLPRCHY